MKYLFNLLDNTGVRGEINVKIVKDITNCTNRWHLWTHASLGRKCALALMQTRTPTHEAPGHCVSVLSLLALSKHYLHGAECTRCIVKLKHWPSGNLCRCATITIVQLLEHSHDSKTPLYAIKPWSYPNFKYLFCVRARVRVCLYRHSWTLRMNGVSQAVVLFSTLPLCAFCCHKCWPKTTWGRTGHICFADYSLSWKETEAGTWRQELKERLLKEQADWLAPPDFLSCFLHSPDTAV